MKQKSSPSRTEKPWETLRESSSKTVYWSHCFSICSICKEAHAWADFLAETVFHGKDPYWSSSWRTASCGRNLTLEQRKGARRKEWQTESIMNQQQFHFLSPLHAWSGGGRIVRSEAETGKNKSRGGRREGGCFYFSLSNSSTNSCQ